MPIKKIIYVGIVKENAKIQTRGNEENRLDLVKFKKSFDEEEIDRNFFICHISLCLLAKLNMEIIFCSLFMGLSSMCLLSEYPSLNFFEL